MTAITPKTDHEHETHGFWVSKSAEELGLHTLSEREYLIAAAPHSTGTTTMIIEGGIQLLDGYELGGTYMNEEPPGSFISLDSDGGGIDLHNHHDYDTHDNELSTSAQDFG